MVFGEHNVWRVFCIHWKLKEKRRKGFCRKKLAKIFLSVTINRFFFWALNALFVFELSGFQEGLPGIDVGRAQKCFPERMLEVPDRELCAACEPHPCPVFFCHLEPVVPSGCRA